LHWIEGNHDFHLGGAFADVPGLKVHPDELDLHLSGEHLHFQHGDRVDRADLGYLRLRRILRNSLVRFLLENLPEGAIRWIARTLSGASRGHREPSPGVRAAFRRFAQEKAQAGVRFLFLGHCHDPDDFAYESGSSRIFYSNCGYPKRDNAYLRWAPGMKEISRVSFLTADSKPLLK
jgi:UDP-2,3-diacylglucosamine hydrolase